MNSDICMLDICMFRRYEAAFQLGDQQNALNLDILISDRDPLSSIIGRCTLYSQGCRMKAYKKPIEITVRVLKPAQGVTLPAQGTSS